MPHIIVEYSAPLSNGCDIGALLHVLRDTLSKRADANIDPARVLTRAYRAENFIGVTQFPDHFVAIQIRLLPGRSPEMRKSIAADLQEKTREFLDNHGLKACVTAEPAELAEGYCGSGYYKNP